jgi:multicomponent K+:H+ antiporter subunit A
MSWHDSIPLLTLLTSLLPAAVIFLMPEERVRTRSAVNMAGATLKVALIGVMLWGVFREHRYELRFPVLPGLDFVLRADALAMFFVTLSGLLWFLTTIYAIAYLEGSPHRSRFFGFFSLCVSATVGIALAGNLFTFVMFYELLTLSTYPLIVHRETDVSRRAGRVYLAYTLGGGAVLLVGAAWLHALLPTVDFNGGAPLAGLGPEHDATLRVIFVLLIAGLGVKAALVPLHGWLPQAMVAPAPVSALLHAVAVVKAGAFGIVRVVYDVYGVDRAYALGLTTPLAVWAAITIVYGSFRALFQDDLKRRLAYSTVSQVSYIALGVAVFGASSSVGGIVHLVHQGLMKITLFFCAGNLAETIGIKKISEMHGVARRMPWTMAAFTAGALGMIGVPPTVGFISKWYLGTGGIEASQHWVLAVLVASSILNAAYFLPVLYIAWFCKPRGKFIEPTGPSSAEGPRCRLETAWGLLLPPLVTAALAVGTGLMAGTPFSPLQWAVLIVDRAYAREVIDRGLVAAPAMFSPGNALLLSALAVPLASAGLLLFRRLRGLALWLAALSALPALVLACSGKPGTSLDLDWLLLHMHFRLDATGQSFLLVTAILWLLAGIYSRGYLSGDPHLRRYFVYFLLTMTGNLGLILSRDMASFYLFYAVMSFSCYPLVIHRGDDKARRAGRVYITLVVVGEAALLAAMLLAAVARNSLLFDQGAAELAVAPTRHLIVGLLLIAFGIKLGILPLHVWLPLAYSAAPMPASAVLSGAMINAGVLGWLRFLPVGEASMPAWGNLCLTIGLVTALYGVVVGVMQRHAKSVLAYSSISQMGLLTLGIGGGLLAHTAWPTIVSAVLVFALHHGLSKGCLFLSVGLAPSATGTSWRQRLLQAGLVVPALVLAGAPLTMGAVGKSSLKYSLAVLPDYWLVILDVLLPLSSVGTTLLMARFLYLIWPDKAAPTSSRSMNANITVPRPRHVAPTILLAWLALLLIVVAAPWLVPAGLVPGRGASLLLSTVRWSNLWPVCLGGILAWSAWRLYQFERRLVLPSVPAGDVIVLWRTARRTVLAWLSPLAGQFNRQPFLFSSLTQFFADNKRLYWTIQTGESTLARWPGVACSMVIVLGIFLISVFLNWHSN